MVKNVSPICSGNGAPNTAIDEVNTSRGRYPSPGARIASSSFQLPSRLIR